MSKVTFGDVVREVKLKIDRNNNPYEFYVAGDHMDTEDLKIRRRGRFATDDVGPAFIREFHVGQILYGSRRTYLKKVVVADFDGVTANTTFVLESKDESVLLQRLIPFLMLSEGFTKWSIMKSKGSTNPYVLFSDIAAYEFELPPMAEQKKLAEVLWAMNDTMEAYKKLLSATDELVKSQFIEMFGGQSIDDLKWPISRMDTVFDITSSKRILKSEWKQSGVPFLRVRDMVRLAMKQPANNEFFVSEDFYARLKDADGIPQAGDIMVSATSTIGKCYEVKAGEHFYYKDADVLRFRKKMDINAAFFIYCMKSPILMDQIEASLGVTTVGHFLIAKAKTLMMPLPPMALQEQFAAFIRQTDKSKFCTQNGIFSPMKALKMCHAEELNWPRKYLSSYKIGYIILKEKALGKGLWTMQNIANGASLFTFVEILLFKKRWEEIGFTDDDLRRLQLILLQNPQAGAMMQGTGGLRKLRFALPGKGKSGGARICYVVFAEFKVIYLITAFTKDEQDNLSQEEKNILKERIKRLRDETARRFRKSEKTTMTSLFDDLCTGLDQAIEFAKGTGETKVTQYIIEPVKRYDQTEIRRIRNQHGVSQSIFANYMGVSKKTVEAWECGRNRPTGPACRLLHILDANMGNNLPFMKLKVEQA